MRRRQRRRVRRRRCRRVLGPRPRDRTGSGDRRRGPRARSPRLRDGPGERVHELRGGDLVRPSRRGRVRVCPADLRSVVRGRRSLRVRHGWPAAHRARRRRRSRPRARGARTDLRGPRRVSVPHPRASSSNAACSTGPRRRSCKISSPAPARTAIRARAGRTPPCARRSPGSERQGGSAVARGTSGGPGGRIDTSWRTSGNRRRRTWRNSAPRAVAPISSTAARRAWCRPATAPRTSRA